jgi:hypothetical protein
LLSAVSNATKRDDVVLYTTTSDSTLRVFLPVLDSPQRLQLHVSLDLFSSLPFSVATKYLTESNTSSPASRIFSIDRQLVRTAIAAILDKHPHPEDAARVRLKEIYDEGWDLFLRVLSDGSVLVTAVAVRIVARL